MSGTLIDGKYEIIGTIGEGGFGTVYAALQPQFDRKVAVKVLKTTLLHESDGAARFEREAKAINALKHKNVVAFYGYGEWQQAPYMVMELVEGRSLQQVLSKDEKLAPMRALKLIRQVFEALAAAHAAGVVHRDLKPSNILITQSASGEEQVKIIDFGLARLMPGYGIPGQKLTETGYALGTCHYMPPEQALGTPVDHRADIYSAGCILYQMLSGKLPFDADNNVAVMFQHINEPPPPLQPLLPGAPQADADALTALVGNCMAKDADARYASADSAVADIDNIIKGNTKAVTPHVVHAKRTVKPQKRSALIAAKVALLTFVAILMLGGFYLLSAQNHDDHESTVSAPNSLAATEKFLSTVATQEEPVTVEQEAQLLQIRANLDDRYTQRDKQLIARLLLEAPYRPGWTERAALDRVRFANDYVATGINDGAYSPAVEGVLSLQAVLKDKRSLDEANSFFRTAICSYIPSVTSQQETPEHKKWCHDCLISHRKWVTLGLVDYKPGKALVDLVSETWPGPDTEAALLYATESRNRYVRSFAEYALGRYYASCGRYEDCDKIGRQAVQKALGKSGERRLDSSELRAGELAHGKTVLSFRPLANGDYAAIERIWKSDPKSANFVYEEQQAKWMARAAVGKKDYESVQSWVDKMTRFSDGKNHTPDAAVRLSAIALYRTGHAQSAQQLESALQPNINASNPQYPEVAWDMRELEAARRGHAN